MGGPAGRVKIVEVAAVCVIPNDRTRLPLAIGQRTFLFEDIASGTRTNRFALVFGAVPIFIAIGVSSEGVVSGV